MSQTQYDLEQGIGAEGGLADTNPAEVNTHGSYTKGVPFGRMLSTLSGTTDGAKTPSAAADTMVGVSLRDTTQTSDQYEPNSAMGVVKKGKVFVEVEQAVTRTDPVFVRFNGKAQINMMDFDIDFVTGNTINLKVDGASMTPVPWNTSHAQTLTDLKDQMIADFLQITGGVAVAVPQEIIVYGLSTGANSEFVISDVVVTGGASQAVATLSEAQASVETSDRGRFRMDADQDASTATDTAVEVPEASYMNDAAAGELVEVDLNLS